MFVWEEGYRIGNEEMDAEHLILFALLNQIDININADMAADVADVLTALDSYIDYHFAHEEALMKAWAYPGLEEHSAKHHEFMNELARLRALVRSGDVMTAAMKLRGFVLTWLLEHIMTVDADYARFIAATKAAKTA